MNVLLFLVASLVIFSAHQSPAQDNEPMAVWENDTELQHELHFLRLERFLDLELNVGSTQGETSWQSPSTVTVIDRQTIEEHNFASISAAVQTLAGIQVYRTAFKQQVATVRGVLQDHYANKVLVMINNVPSWHAVTGEGNLDRVSIHDVERIEVLRGPASVTYGTQAYVGAVNIILRQSDLNSKTAEVHTGIGNKGAHAIGTHYRYRSDSGLSVFAALNQERGNRYHTGYTDEDGVTGTLDDYQDQANASVLLEYQAHALLLNAFQNDEGNFEGSTQKFSAGAGNNHDVDGFLLGYTYTHHWQDNFYSKLQLFYDRNERNFSRSADDDIRANVLGQRLGGNIRNIYAIYDTLTLEVGGDYEFRKSQEYKNIQLSTDTLLADNNLSNRHVHEYSGYAQMDWQLSPAWRAIVGSRLTRSDTFGKNVSSRGTIVYSINAHNAIKLIAGQSFRTPSLFELYFITPTNTVFGNEDLNPETADTIELAYQHRQGYFYLQTLAYYSIYQNKIHRITGDVPLADGTLAKNVSVYTNGDEFTATGLEIELKYLNPQWANVFLNLDYVEGDDGDRLPGTDHYNFKYVPNFTASAGVYKNIRGIGLSLLGNYIDSSQGSQAKVDDSMSLDLSLAYQHKYSFLQLKHILSIQNLTDTAVTFPEYVRRRSLNELPLSGSDRSIFYTLIVNF